MQGWAYDIEADNLYLKAKKVWYMHFKSLDGERTMSIHPFREGMEESAKKIKEWIHSFEDGALVVSFNGLGYDHWVLWKLFGIVPRVGKGGKDTLDGKEVVNIDCYVLSQYLSPDLQSHSLAALSAGFAEEKIDYRKRLIEVGAMSKDEPKGHEFSFFHPFMEEYCDADVAATIGVFKRQWTKAKEMYGDAWVHPSFRQMQKDYWLYSAQAYTGVAFHKERALALVAKAEAEMEKIKAIVDPQLPPRPLKTAEQDFYKIPAKPFKKDGTLSSSMVNWLEKHSATLKDGVIYAYGISAPLEANTIFPVKLPMEIDDNAELKDYFLQAGWVPHDDFWNFKKGKDGKPLRDERGKLIKTTPKIAHQGKICPNLSKVNGEIPKLVVKYLSYRNRLGVVQGWLDNWRLDFDGRLSAEISGYTPSFRVKHKVVVNCPKADPTVLLGEEMRDLFVTQEGRHYLGTDAAALENRTVAAYTMKYDGGKFADIVLNGDSHTHNAFAFFPEIADKWSPDTPDLKENPEFKPYRNKAKTGAYLLAYGGGVAKLASSLGLSKAEAQRSYDNYWAMNEGLGKLKEAIEKYYDSKGKKKYIPAWDGRLLSARGKNILINLAGQSLGAIAMSIAACMMDSRLGELYIDDLGRPYYLYKGKKVMRVSMVHDEYSWEVEDGVQDEVSKMSVDCIIKAGEFLKLPLELDGEGKIGNSWKMVH